MSLRYEFDFQDGRSEAFDLDLDPASGILAEIPGPRDEDWINLDCHQCPDCSLHKDGNPFCPVARNLSGILSRFEADLSHTPVVVRAIVHGRMTEKRLPLQEGLGSLMGLVMATSGCPVLDRFRPMVHTHLPFATCEETVMRAVSCYLTAQYVVAASGGTPDWTLSRFGDMYARINDINAAFAMRFRRRRMRDANINALLFLDTFAQMARFPLEEWVAEVRPYFSAFLAAGDSNRPPTASASAATQPSPGTDT